jgi:phospholipase/lecithinase/hemolysin
MTKARVIRFMLLGLLTWIVFLPIAALADSACSKLIVFGDSLSDSGNAFALTGQSSVPPYPNVDQFQVPDAPYAKGGLHFSNGETWVEGFAKTLGANRSAGPAFRMPGVFCNFAVGSARAGGTSPIDLTGQVGIFVGSSVPGESLDNALAVIVIGGNDVRDAIVDPANAVAIIGNAINAVYNSILTLEGVGVKRFLVGNVPNLALTPAIRTLDTLVPGAAGLAMTLSIAFNQELAQALVALQNSDPDIKIAEFDIFATVGEVANNPASFGLTDTVDACVTPNVPPFTCQKPDTFAFWDGVHPTKVLHGILADAASGALTAQ